jgi:glycosyltransferase involved in cell wall biosynthesis
MKICLVTAFPPSRGGLSEYGYHIARELRQNPLLSLIVLADVVPEIPEEEKEPSVVRCWNFNDRKSARKILQTIREIDPDVVWFNLLFTTFGHDPLAAFHGLTLPLLTRLAGFYTHVTLHHLMDFIDLEGAGVRFPSLYRAAGAVSTKMLLLSNSVSVLMPAYRSILLRKYGGDNVHFRAHGILTQNPEYPSFSRRNNPVRILAFGKWGTYKRLEPLLAAFQTVAATNPSVKLVIAGGDHPRTPGYVASLANRYANSTIEFTGYIPEEKVADLFRGASILVMPYSSATGASGVAHLACAYGVPIVSSDIPDFAHMASEEGMAIEFYKTGDTQDLAAKLVKLLEFPERQKAMAIQNFSAALRMTMPRIIHEYVRHFGRAQQTRALRPIRWFRRLPRWMSRSFAGQVMLRALMIVNHRLRSSRTRPGALNHVQLFNPNGQGGGHLSAAGSANDVDYVAGSRPDAPLSAAAAGAEKDATAGQQHDENNPHHLLPPYFPDAHKSHYPEREQARVEDALLPFSPAEGRGNWSNGNGKNGSCAPRADGNDRRGKGTTQTDGQVRAVE